MEVVKLKTPLDTEIEAMNARMDSFVDQINRHKSDMYTHAQKNLDALIAEVKNYDPYFKQVEGVMANFEYLADKITALEKQDKRMVNDIASNSKLYSDLMVDIKTCINNQKLLSKSMEKFEGYFSQYNFESILDELVKLDEEYQQKVTSVITKLSIKKQHHNMELFLTGLRKTNMTSRTVNCLWAEGIEFLGDIICLPDLKWSYPSRNEYRCPLLKTPNFGRKSYKELVEFMYSKGYSKPITCEEYWVERKRVTGKDFKLDI